jgi:hypothetical protein
VNYYEDFQFMGLFDPNPDYPFSGPKELCVEGSELGLSLTDFGLSISAWSVKQGQIAAGGAEAALVAAVNGMAAAVIRVPRAGMIGPVPGDLQARLFSVFYYGDDDASIDPFAEVREFCRKVKGAVADKQKALAEKRSSSRVAVWVFTFLAAVVLLAMILTRSAPAGMMLPLIAFGGLAIWKKVALSGIDAELVKYGVGPVRAPVALKAAAQHVITPAPVALETVAAKPEPGPEVLEPVAVKPSPTVSVEPEHIHNENWFVAHWKLIAGVAVGLVMLLVIAQAVIRNQNEKSASDDAAMAAEKAKNAKGRDVFDRLFYERNCDAGDAPACGKAAVMNAEGRGTEAPDPVKALALHKKACTGGIAASCEAVKTAEAGK